MKKLMCVALVLIACSIPMTQTSLMYDRPDAYDKMLSALAETGWTILHSEKSSGLITAKKLHFAEAVVTSMTDAQNRHHVVSIKIENGKLNITISQPGEADFLKTSQYKADELLKELTEKFESYTSK